MNAKDFFQHHWQTFEQCPQQRRNLLREAQVATVSNGQPKTRTVILRDIEHYSVYFHTDYRSDKVKALVDNPHIALTCYDHQQKLQFNLQGSAIIHHQDDLCRQRWQATKAFAKRCYLAPEVPGTISAGPTANLPDHLLNRAPTEEESQPGFENFSVINIELHCCDLLSLAHDGHKAARALFSQQKLSEAHWICP